MKDSLAIKPFTLPVSGEVRLPGSKSITNRALLLAALSPGPVTLRNALFSRDTRLMVNALRGLGFQVVTNEEKGQIIRIEGKGGRIPVGEASLDVGNAGTAARFLTAFLSLKKGGVYHLDGDPAMRERPMVGLLEALIDQGTEVNFSGQQWYFPFSLSTKGLPGGDIEVDAAASSQILSALLMVAPFARKDTVLRLKGTTVSRPFVEMTVNMLRQFGYKISAEAAHFEVASHQVPSGSIADYLIEPDATAASYFLALPLAVGGKVVVKNLGGNDFLQGDIRFKEVISQTGLSIKSDGCDLIANYNSGNKIRVRADFNAISDTFLTLAAISPLLEGVTRITGIGHTRHQETDRISAVAKELRKLGQEVVEEEDALEIHPNRRALLEKARAGVCIETYDDHRIAMSFSILGCADILENGEFWLKIANPSCVEKTFPHFFSILEGIR